MTSEERAMLTDLADKIAKTPAPVHDPEADDFIRNNIGKRPDALYILTQTTLIQNLAIQHAQQEIQDLKQRVAQSAPAQSSSSFLGGGAPPSPRPGASQWNAPASTPPPLPQSAPPYSPSAPPSSPSSEAPSFLRSAAQTAAGVAAGAFAFEGIRSLFGGGGFGGGWGMPHFGGGSFLGGAPGGETVINNYYDNPDASERDVADRSDRDDTDDSSADDTNADDSSADDADNSGDDNAGDDTDASYDDGGGYDDGGSSGGDDLA